MEWLLAEPPGCSRRRIDRGHCSCPSGRERNSGSYTENASELPAADQPVNRARAVGEALAPSERQLVDHGKRKRLWNVVQRQRLVALALVGRNYAVSAAPESRISLHTVSAGNQLGECVRRQQPGALGEAVFSLKLQGMKRRVSSVLVLAEQCAAILRIRQ